MADVDAWQVLLVVIQLDMVWPAYFSWTGFLLRRANRLVQVVDNWLYLSLGHGAPELPGFKGLFESVDVGLPHALVLRTVLKDLGRWCHQVVVDLLHFAYHLFGLSSFGVSLC